jgi:hypothetical protein
MLDVAVRRTTVRADGLQGLVSRSHGRGLCPRRGGAGRHERDLAGGYRRVQLQPRGHPASGLLTGQDCCKTQHEVDLFGGFTGNFEGNVPSADGGCVDNPFRWCDNLANNDPKVLTFMSKAFATMVVQMAFDTKVMSASNSTVFDKKLPIAGETSRRLVAK